MLKRLVSSILTAVVLLAGLAVFPAEGSERETLRVGFFAFSGYHIIDESGRRSGYGYEFLQRLSIHTGWSYEYIGYDGSYSNALEMLKNGELDIVTSVSKTPEREKDFLFSEQDIGVNSTIMTVKAGSTKVVEGDYSTYDGITVGMINGNSKNANFEEFAKKRGFSFVPKYFDVEDELTEALENETVDAAVTGSLRQLGNEWVIESFDASPFYICVNKNRSDLMNKINTAINEMDLHDPDWRSTLHNTYYSTSSTDSILINAEERVFLEKLRASGKPLKVLVNPSAPPYSYFEDGEAKGILPTIFASLAKRLSVDYEYIPAENLDEYLKLRADGSADIVLDFSGDYYIAEEEGYKITVPYYHTNFARLTRRNFEGTANTIAVVDDMDALYSYVTSRYKDRIIVTYNTTEECAEAVINGDVDAAIMYTYTARQYVSRDSRNRLSSAVLGATSFSYAVGTDVPDGKNLLSLLDKGADSFTEAELDTIAARYLNSAQNLNLSLVDFLYRNPIYSLFIVIFIFLLLFAFAMVVVRTRNQKRLKSEVDTATAELEQKTRDLSVALDAADTANRAKTAFLNNMSHDIRTPMNAIIGYTALASTHSGNQERVQDYLSKISQASNHLLSLINDVLDMSRIESGKVTINERPENLANILQELRNIIQSDIHAKRMELFIDTVDVLDEEIYCDRLRLNQILLNLTSNAIKFTPAGGTVDIRVTQSPSPKAGYARYEFRVSDNGIGMDEDFAKTVFEPFTREQTSTVSGIQGTGLGMAITKNIVDMMDGDISVKSEHGKGTTFTVSLELRLAGKHREIEPISELSGMRGLVVDDDLVCCQSVSKMLREIGMRSEWALSGREAVARTTEAADLNDPFEVYIVDWSMPEQNGIETVRQIRRIAGEKSPIILMSAYDWSDIEQEARKAGATGFINKPLFASDLHGVLERSIGNGAQSANNSAVTQPNELFKDKRLLLVEDNELNREIAQEILKEAGFTVETAENGRIACDMVEKADAGYYDLILMDIQMPIMDGCEATRAIRSMDDPARAGIPIVAMTANAFEEDREKTLQTGMDGYLAKPIDIEKMMTFLREKFDRS